MRCFKSGIDLVDGVNTRSMYEGQESTSSHWRRYKLWGDGGKEGHRMILAIQMLIDVEGLFPGPINEAHRLF